jgi:hypothetical protein
MLAYRSVFGWRGFVGGNGKELDPDGEFDGNPGARDRCQQSGKIKVIDEMNNLSQDWEKELEEIGCSVSEP